MASHRVISSNQFCSLCIRNQAALFCSCKSASHIFCEACSPRHFKQVKDTKKMHRIYPIGTLNYYMQPGYLEAFENRSGEVMEKACEELRGNVRRIEELEHVIEAKTAALTNRIHLRSSELLLELQALNENLRLSIESGIQEMEDSVYHPNPVLHSALAKHLREHTSRSMQFTSVETDVIGMFEHCEELISAMKIVIGVKIPTALQADAFLEQREKRTVIVVDAGEAKEYVGEVNNRKEKEGFGVLQLADGGVVEGSWRNDRLDRKVKCWWPDGSFFLGLRNAHIKECSTWQRTRWKYFSAIALLSVLFAAVVLNGANLEKRFAWQKTNGRCVLWSRDAASTAEGKYTGEWNDYSQFHGHGVMRFNNGTVYEGYWRNNRMHGYGTLTTVGGNSTEGLWLDGCLHGLASKKSPDGSVYLGEWSSSMFHGYGILITSDSVSYGKFKDGKMHGSACVLSSHGDVFVGDFQRGERSGHGVEISELVMCQSEYRSDLKDGNGTCVYSSGVSFAGNWRRGVKEGMGTESYPSETVSGEWHNDTRTFGLLTYEKTYRAEYVSSTFHLQSLPKGEKFPSATSETQTLLSKKEISPQVVLLGPVKTLEGLYLGEWNIMGERHGYGTQTYKDGSSYVGFWADGVKHGQGKLLSADGSVYEGGWAHGKKQGYGEQTNESGGSTYRGTWTNDLMQGIGLTHEETAAKVNVTYMGEFVNGKASGQGFRISSNRDIYAGQWRSGKKEGQGLEFSSDTVCIAIYKSDLKDGVGTCTNAEGVTYRGQWSAGQRNGQGNELYPSELFKGTWKNDSSKVGDFRNEEKYRIRIIASILNRTDQRKAEIIQTYPAQLTQAILGFLSSNRVDPILTRLPPVSDTFGIFDGQWSIDGKRYGFGLQNYSSGAIYEGEWENGLKHGHGRFIDIRGDFYEGQWVNDVKHGFGLWQCADDDVNFQGVWKNDDNYHGVFTDAKNGLIYEGEWRDNRIQGYGVLQRRDEGRYEGSWKNREMSGIGNFSFAKFSYTGSWVSDWMQGSGTMTLLVTSTLGNRMNVVYQGEFRNSKLNGLGAAFVDGKLAFAGVWRNGRPSDKLPALCSQWFDNCPQSVQREFRLVANFASGECWNYLYFSNFLTITSSKTILLTGLTFQRSLSCNDFPLLEQFSIILGEYSKGPILFSEDFHLKLGENDTVIVMFKQEVLLMADTPYTLVTNLLGNVRRVETFATTSQGGITIAQSSTGKFLADYRFNSYPNGVIFDVLYKDTCEMSCYTDD